MSNSLARKPIFIKFVEFLIARFRYPALTMGCAIFFSLLALYASTGVMFPRIDGKLFSSELEAIGLFLLSAAVPAYLIMCLIAWFRSSKSLYQQIDQLLDKDSMREIDRYKYSRFWPAAMLAGLVFATTNNIGWGGLYFNPESEFFVLSVFLVCNQFLLWSVIGIVLYLIFCDDLQLYALGKKVRISLYDLNSLNAFGKAGLNGLLIVVGALVLSTVQSIDREFRWFNYLNGLYVGLPGSVFLVLVPIWSVHVRIKSLKREALEQIEDKIRQTSVALDPDSIVLLNGLLQRRDIVQSFRVWPMDLSIFSRFVLYVFIPPLAWAGAALTELLVDSFIVG